MAGAVWSRHRLLNPALLVVALAVLYLLTMYPDVLASGDSAKFQYIGPVLGTPHSPGYPLYMFVSYAWSWLPLGTLAWRMNLLSVAASLTAVVCVYAAARRLGAGTVMAALVAAALGVGRIYWEKSLAAEVYSLGCALLAAAIWRVLVWRDSRKTRDLLVVVALLSLGLGNHLTIATVAPAFVAFALAVDARALTRWRTMLAALAIVLGGISQYAYIVWRTWSNSPHLEARASTAAELFDVMRATRYEGDMFARGWRELMGEPLAAILSALSTEFGYAGMAVVLGGLAAGLRADWKATVLLVGSAVGICALTLNIRADTAGFLVAALPPLWLLAALIPARFPATSPAVLAAAALLAMGVGLSAVKNFRYVDHSDRTAERRLWTAIFEAIPDGSRILTQSYAVDQSLLYMLHGEHVSRRDIALMPPVLPALDRAFRVEGRTVVAFAGHVESLRRAGLEFEPLPLFDSPIPDLATASRRDRFVVAAFQPEARALLTAHAPGFVRALGGTALREAERHILVGTARASRAPIERTDAERASLSLAAGTRVGAGAALPVPVDVDVRAGSLRIRIDGRDAVTTTAPMAVVVLAEGGQVRRRLVPAMGGTLRPALDTPAFRLTRSVSCIDVGDRRWHDVTAVAGRQIRARFDNYRDHAASMTLYLGGAGPFRISMRDAAGSKAPDVIARPIPEPDRRRTLAGEGAPLLEAMMSAPQVVRLDVRVLDPVDLAVLTVDLGAVPDVIIATGSADRVAAPRVRVCN
jgi:hypothetical protein